MSQSKPSTPEPSEIAGRYQVVQKLGAGAFGTVFKAKDRVLGRMLAIKTIKVESLIAAGASLEEMSERFEREAKVSAQLKHPNIVTIHDLGDAEGMKYLAMEFIDGVGLDKVIAGAGRLPLERAANIGAQVADALDFAHRHKVVHRDIKPANIMIETGDRVKVTDFGIAKLTEGEQHLTMTGSLLGTPSYMSPEQARGNPVDGRSDLFSMGCVLYEMLAGRKAFRGESITALIFKIITEEPPSIHELDPSIPDEMVRIIGKALAKAPEARYQTGRELADDLLALTRPGTSPTVRQAETPTVPTPAVSPVAAPTVRGAAGTMPGATVQSPPTARAAGTAGVPPAPPTQLVEPKPIPPPRPLSPPPPPPRPMAQAAPRKSGGGAGLLIGLGLAGLLFVGAAAGAGWYFFLRKPAETQTAGNLTGGGAATSPGSSAGGAAQPPGTQPSTSVSGGEAPPVSAPPVTTAAPPPVTTPTRTAGTASNTGPAPGRPPGGGAPTGGTATKTEPIRPEPPPPTGAASMLDEEPPETTDGRAAGEQLADKFRSNQGWQRSGGTFGSSARFKARERSPRNVAPVERPAVATLRHVINAEEAFRKTHGRYGTFGEMATAQTLFLDVPHQGGGFQRAGYRFRLTLEGESFKVVAMPMNPDRRTFTGDDSGYIRVGLE